MSEFVDKIDNTIKDLHTKCQKDNAYRLSKDATVLINQIADDIEKQLPDNSIQFLIFLILLDDKAIKAKLLMLKGKVLDLQENYNKEAEDALSKAVSPKFENNPIAEIRSNFQGDLDSLRYHLSLILPPRQHPLEEKGLRRSQKSFRKLP